MKNGYQPKTSNLVIPPNRGSSIQVPKSANDVLLGRIEALERLMVEMNDKLDYLVAKKVKKENK